MPFHVLFFRTSPVMASSKEARRKSFMAYLLLKIPRPPSVTSTRLEQPAFNQRQMSDENCVLRRFKQLQTSTSNSHPRRHTPGASHIHKENQASTRPRQLQSTLQDEFKTRPNNPVNPPRIDAPPLTLPHHQPVSSPSPSPQAHYPLPTASY